MKQKIQAPKLHDSTTNKLSRCLRSSERYQEPPNNPECHQRYAFQLLENSDGSVLIRFRQAQLRRASRTSTQRPQPNSPTSLLRAQHRTHLLLQANSLQITTPSSRPFCHGTIPEFPPSPISPLSYSSSLPDISTSSDIL